MKAKAIDFSYKEASLEDYVSLMKPRVMSLILFSAGVGMYMAPGHIHPLLAFVTIICVILGSGGAAAINMWYDVDIDSVMSRTQNRPTVRGVIAADDALAFGLIMSFFAIMLMLVCVSYVAASLLAFSISFYILVYTIWLKRSSVQNIVIGGAAGALPPMIGWAAVTGSVSFESFVLFMLIFLWTPPHFWALALYKSDDYRKCNIPMMPIVKSDRYTKIQMVFYSICTVATSIIPYSLGMNGALYLFGAIILGARLIILNARLLQDKENIKAPSFFIYSIQYMFAIFALMILDKVLI